MNGLFSRPEFAGFGCDRLHSPSAAPAIVRLSLAGSGPCGGNGSTGRRRTAAGRAELRRRCGAGPGVYGMIDVHGDLIYVGKAKRLRPRLLSYFRPRSRDPKAGRILAHAAEIIWEPTGSEFAALLRELELIQRWRPRFNVQGQPERRRQSYICLGGAPAPHLYVSRQPAAGVECHGPVFGGKAARAAVRHLNDLFQLRDCPGRPAMIFSDDAGLFSDRHTPGCMRLELGTCLGPCAAACSRAGYRRRAAEARAFLRGQDQQAVERLQGEMLAAAAAQDFERAARLRDRLTLVRRLKFQLDRARHWRDRFSFVYRLRGEDGREFWYAIDRGCVHAAASTAVPSTLPAFLRQLQELSRARSAPATPPGPREVDSLLVVAAWFRRYPQQLRATLSFADAWRLLSRTWKSGSKAPAPAAG